MEEKNFKLELLVCTGKSIHEKLKKSGVPQKEFAKRIPKVYGTGNISASELSRYLMGKTTMRAITLYHICKELGYTVYDFIDDLFNNYLGKDLKNLWVTKDAIKYFETDVFDLKREREKANLTDEEVFQRSYQLYDNNLSLASISRFEDPTIPQYRKINIYDFLLYFLAIMNCKIVDIDELRKENNSKEKMVI